MNDQSNLAQSANINNKTHHNLNNKQIAYLTARIQGKSKEESKRIAHYKASTYNIEQNPNLKAALMSCMQVNGLNEQFLIDKLKQGVESDKIHFFAKDGIVTDERTVPDMDVRHKYLRDILEIRGDIKNDNTQNLNIGIIAIPNGVSVDDWNGELNKSENEKAIDNSDDKSANIETINDELPSENENA